MLTKQFARIFANQFTADIKGHGGQKRPLSEAREREGQKKTQGHMNNLLNSSKCTTHLVSRAVEWGWSKQKVNVISNETAVKEEKWSLCKRKSRLRNAKT